MTSILFGLGVNGEPFMVFHFGDLLMFGGGFVLVIGLWAAWYWRAIRRHRLAWPILAVVACWAAANVWVAQWLLAAYVNEPWRG